MLTHFGRICHHGIFCHHPGQTGGGNDDLQSHRGPAQCLARPPGETVVLVQPLAAPMIGIEAAQAEFQRIWRCLPDLRAHVDHWCGDADLVFIEFRLRTQIGDTAAEWPNVNRLVLHDGKAIERVTYFDPLAILPTLLRHPSIWWRWWRSRLTCPLGSPICNSHCPLHTTDSSL
jgi:hypothetical protein